MDPRLLFRELENLAERFEITVRYYRFVDSDIDIKSGLCNIKGRPFLFVEESATIEERIDIFVHCLVNFDLQRVFIKPALRDYLVDFKRQKNGKVCVGGEEYLRTKPPRHSRLKLT